MIREERYRLVYEVPTANGEWSKKSCVVKSRERLNENVEACKKYGYKVVSKDKLYPFSTERNQHNFDLIVSLCSNQMHDMEMGDTKWDAKKYDELYENKKTAEELFCLDLPVAWIDWKTYENAKRLSAWAVEHRANRCVESGHPELVQYC